MRMPSHKMETDRSVPLQVDNVESGETIHQRCLLVKGRSPFCEAYGDYLKVTVVDAFGRSSPAQTWPMSQGVFKALIMLSPGSNTVQLERHHNNNAHESITLSLTYVPLLQTPPLHCAIMIAQDSPLLMDCPTYKAAGISSAHSSLDAAIAKFRTTAYMWQALTAEDMRSKGLGRRSFRLDEEYGLDTTWRASMSTLGRRNRSEAMGSVAKIHLVRSKKTTAELRDVQVAQQNPRASGRDDLHKYFEYALKAHGGVFDSSTRPVVAGLILDSHYSTDDSLLLGHAALGCHNPDGLSLGVFGSHLTYSWPRFFDEIAACLTDTTPPGDSLCNDNGECETAWEACSIGQGAFLHEVGHAFGAPHTTGIMARGYAQDWPKCFLAETAYCAKTKSDGATVVDGQTKNEACWDLKDALSFACFPHFKLPEDKTMSEDVRKSPPTIRPLIEDGEARTLVVECKAGIAGVTFQNGKPCQMNPQLTFKVENVQPQVTLNLADFDRAKPLAISVLGMNGKDRKLANAWRLLPKLAYVRIPDSDIVLHKRSISCEKTDEQEDTMLPLSWAVMLHEKGPSGALSRANAIDLRVGAIMDGAVVYFADGHKTNCGPRYGHNGGEYHFGGHASEKFDLPKGAEIIKVEINRGGRGWGSLSGIRVTLSTGKVAGELNVHDYGYDDEEEEEGGSPKGTVETLEPADGEKIVGFFGQSMKSCGFCTEFGIITADKDFELPPQTYDLAELQNRSG